MIGTRGLVTVVINNWRVLAETLLKKPSQVHSNETETKNLFDGRWSLHKNRANTSRYSNAPLRYRMFHVVKILNPIKISLFS